MRVEEVNSHRAKLEQTLVKLCIKIYLQAVLLMEGVVQEKPLGYL